MPFQIVRNDITKMQTDAVVNAANTRLLRGSGVCGAIFAAADALALAVCHSWRAPMQGRVASLDAQVARSRAGFEAKVAVARESAASRGIRGRGSAADQERARAAARGMARTKGVRW